VNVAVLFVYEFIVLCSLFIEKRHRGGINGRRKSKS
jgi:hypothetical protein